MRIRIGVPVVADDGRAGRVEGIILRPQTNQVEGVVAAQGWLLAKNVVIPADRILAAEEHCLRVRGTAEEISSLELFSRSQFTAPPEDWIPPLEEPASAYLFPASPYLVGAFKRPATQPPPAEHEVEELREGDVEVGGGTLVYCTDGVAGTLDRVLTEGDTDKVSHLVVHRGTILSREMLVPVDRVASVGEEGIRLTLAEKDLDDLPDYKE